MTTVAVPFVLFRRAVRHEAPQAKVTLGPPFYHLFQVFAERSGRFADGNSVPRKVTV
jgi:hypothetical protein